MSEPIGYYVNDNYAFTISLDEKGRKVGTLRDIKTGKVLGESMYQRVLPENIDNLLNVAKIIISAAWQDGKITSSEKDAFSKAFRNIDFTEQQQREIEAEFNKPTPVEEMIGKITNREEKLLILETSLLLIIADKEFHPKEKDFIEYLVKEFKLDSEDYALLYYILPEQVKKYIIKEKIHKTLQINTKEIKVLNKFSSAKSDTQVNHDKVYTHFIDSWKDRSYRYKRLSVY
ncbi:MAG: TerB family tellurite resistance protein [Candidatus Cloacimonetes bacterium]|nr:TerB family tellurite resistance protein [Candidatus Cloacimonadota bacterium]